MFKCKSSLLTTLFIVVFSMRIFACGPGFPNSYLMGGDGMLVGDPKFSFTQEIKRIEFDTSAEFNAVYAKSMFQLDIEELSEALGNCGYDTNKIDQTVSSYKSIREAIQKFQQDCAKKQNKRSEESGNKSMPAITFSVDQIPEAIPDEFSLYLRGVIYYRTDELTKAVVAWQEIFELAPSKRQYRSTWAAYMLGKCMTHQFPKIAVFWYQKVRQLVREGFRDSQSLAASSYGQEAAIYLHQKQYNKAIELYMVQKQTGDRFAIPSLMFASRDIFKNCDMKELTELVKNPLTRNVLTAYAISRYRFGKPTWNHDSTQSAGPQPSLLTAIEHAHLESVKQADRIAMIAYKTGDFKRAHRWLVTADPDSIISRRVRAKLYIRDGKIKESIEDLEFIARQIPSGELISSYEYDRLDTPYKLYSELATLYVSQAMYFQALDALLKGGNWVDAAYIAERVLTPEELKRYVDENWPDGLPEQEDRKTAHEGWYIVGDRVTAIRHLLARRLTRLKRYDDARRYFPKEYLKNFNTFVASLHKGNKTQLADDLQADAYWTAAWLARHQGIELMGTELDPDWHIYSGNMVQGKRLDLRQSFLEQNIFNVPSYDEIKRAKVHIALPQKLYHYRYIASEIAWQSTLLMPDNDDETARRLCLAGTWHKYNDKHYADTYYKALVNRCRQTELGEEADRIRWFPKISDTLNAESLRDN